MDTLRFGLNRMYWFFLGLDSFWRLGSYWRALCAWPLAVARRLGFDWGGAGIAKYRTEDVSSPVFRFRYYGAIEGRIINIDRSGSDAVRLTLDRVIFN